MHDNVGLRGALVGIRPVKVIGFVEVRGAAVVVLSIVRVVLEGRVQAIGGMRGEGIVRHRLRLTIILCWVLRV